MTIDDQWRAAVGAFGLMKTEEPWKAMVTSFAQQKEAFLAQHLGEFTSSDCWEFPVKTVLTEGKIWFSQLIALVPFGRSRTREGLTELEAISRYPYRILHFEVSWNTEPVTEPAREGVTFERMRNEEDAQ